jgi:hypothetical protein
MWSRKMTSSEIEGLIAEAISNRPKVANAAMSLYIHKGKLICGARIVMPDDAVFVARVPPDRFDSGFSEREWKLIVEKVENIMAKVKVTANAQAAAAASRSQAKGAEQKRFIERRKERRLRNYHPIWFAEDLGREPMLGQMADICSGGMAFTCDSDDDYLCPGQQITTRFNVPRFGSGSFPEAVSFERTGSICRVDGSNSLSRRVAIQFAEPLPFKPAEQPCSTP